MTEKNLLQLILDEAPIIEIQLEAFRLQNEAKIWRKACELVAYLASSYVSDSSYSPSLEEYVKDWYNQAKVIIETENDKSENTNS